ncbi:MAG: chromate resistance protein ChrB domain-containing protein [Acidobacteriota bacterium]
MGEKGTWLLLLYTLPARKNAERVHLWRRLKKIGAVQLKTSAHILPDRPDCRERFLWLSKELEDRGCEAYMVHAAEIEGLARADAEAMFNCGRSADYRALSAELAAWTRGRTGKSQQTLVAELAAFQRRLQGIWSIDYFRCPEGRRASAQLERARRLLYPEKRARQARQAARYAGRTWVTRERPEIDRVASAWLIRNFIDRNARFVFSTNRTEHPDAIGFDMPNAQFSHENGGCTFETLVRRFGIQDPALRVVAEIVHDTDLEDEKYGRLEGIGLQRVLQGWGASPMNDQDILERGFTLFDALYDTLQTTTTQRKLGRK